MTTHDPALVEAVARALDRNGVMDVPDGTVGISCGWPENAKYHLRVDACRALDAMARLALPADVAGLVDAQARDIEMYRTKIAGLFAAIEHGDEKHRTWLREKIVAHFALQRFPND